MSDLTPDRRIKTLPRDSDKYHAVSGATRQRYENWQDLVQHEATGFVAVVVMFEKPLQPWISGPFLIESDAVKAKRRLLRQAKAEHPGKKMGSTVRIVWKDRT